MPVLITRMVMMKKISVNILYVALFVGAVLASCTLNVNQTDGVREVDLRVASQILSGSLSSDNGGLMLSLNDALTNFSEGNFIPNVESDRISEDRSGRGEETEYEYAYHHQTGVHVISFQRQIEKPLFKKRVTDTLNYIFWNKSGDYIANPHQKRDRIKSITYSAYKKGSITTLSKESRFVRKDTLLIRGLLDASPTLSIDGVHHEEGTITLEFKGKPVKRLYELEINFLNFKVDKTFADSDLHRGITGTLSWRMRIGTNANTQIMQGTIVLSGDGTALLNFGNYFNSYEINIKSGEVNNLKHEFAGAVQSIDIKNQRITLVNGMAVYITDKTAFDGEKFASFAIVQQAYSSDDFIWVEGEGSVQNGKFIVSEIEFDNDVSANIMYGEGEGAVEFESYVTSVNSDIGTFTLGGQVTVAVDDKTIIEESSEYQSLQAVVQALKNGAEIEVSGEAQSVDNNAGAALVAISVDFEREEED